LIIPNAGNNITGYTRGHATIEAINGERVVSASGSYESGDVSVSATGGVFALVSHSSTSSTVSQLTAIGLDATSSLSVMGDVSTLMVVGNWGGTVNVSGSPLDETDGVIYTVNVDGNIQANAALNAANFFDLHVNGTIDSNVSDSGTLTDSNPSDPVTMAGSTVATIFLDGTSNVEATWSSVFGKVMSVDVTGKGKADLVLAEGNVSDAALEDIASAGEIGEGSANLGDLSVDYGVKLDDVVIQGSADSIVARQINDLWISGSGGHLVIGKLNNADIGDDVDMLTVQKAKNVLIDGDVNWINAFKLQRVTVLGWTDTLYMTGTKAGHAKGAILNSIFAEGVDYQNFNLDDPDDHVKVRNTTGLY
jgi:hypothetical protein